MVTKNNIDTESLVELYGDYLFNVAYSKLRNRELSLDFVQETFLTILEKGDQFEERASLRTYLTTILNRKIIDFWRKNKRQATDNLLDDGGMYEAPDTASRPTDFGLLELEKQNSLAECMQKLPSQWREILEAKYEEEKSGEEICKDFEITKSNFWVIVHRAKMALRDCLGENFLS